MAQIKTYRQLQFYSELIKKLAVTVLLILFSASGWAISPEIEAQQKQLKSEQYIWSSVKLPEGIELEAVTADNRGSGYKDVSLYGKNIYFTYTGDLQFDIKHLSALLRPTKDQFPVVLNDISTFSIDVQSGDLLLAPKSLAYLFNRHVLNYAQRPLRNVHISVEDKQLVIDAEMQLKAPYPSMWIKSQIKAQVRLDEQKRISIDVTSLEAFNLPLAWAMNLLKLDLNLFIDLERPGIALEERSIKVDLSVLPPPQLTGTLHSAAVTAGGLHLVFAEDKPITFDQPPVASDSYLWLQSGDIRIADMVILNGHMQALNTKPEERVLFNLYQCRDQIAKGSLRITERGEVIAYLPSQF